MANYYVNDSAQASGDHEVHRQGCYWLGLIASKTYLGDHLSCHGAVVAASAHYHQVNGCAHCSPACHTG